MRRLVFRWLTGAAVGTALIAATSPLFVRSYLVRSVDPVRGVPVLPSGSSYRWRSEGYATTQVGPHGMPGKTAIANHDRGIQRIALWGDSQAEGVCVVDRDKLFAQVERRSGGAMQVFPLARSGDDLADWIQQMPPVEIELAIDRHVLLIQDLDDLLATESPRDTSRQTGFRTVLPSFVIQAARNLATQQDGNQLRKLRFGVGPVAAPPRQTPDQSVPLRDWRAGLNRLKTAVSRPVTIVYVPPLPRIAHGQVTWQDRWAADATRVRTTAESIGIQFLDLHSTFCDAARGGRWPHGFHNGQIGNGHLNAGGNALIATALIDAIGQL